MSFGWALRRDLAVATRRRADSLNLVGFFILACTMFPLAVGPQREWLQRIGPGVVWVAALLAVLLALPRLFEHDLADGSLDLMLASDRSLTAIVGGKLAAAWLVSAAPLVLASPLMALAFSLDGPTTALLALSLLLGTPILVAIGAIGASLTLGLRGAPTLITLLCLPLFVPALIFGAGGVEAHAAGLSPWPHFALLAAGMLTSLVLAPWLAALGLRVSSE